MPDILLGLLYPSRCPLCGKIADGVCKSCEKELKRVEEPRCFRCGKPLSADDEEYCPDCRKGAHCYTEGRSLFLYQGAVKESIHKIKYQNKREYLEYYAEEIAQRFGTQIDRWDPDVLIPIPMHPKKQRRRGYNQSAVLAGKLGEFTGIPVCEGALQKVRSTKEQKELSSRQRRENLKGAFVVREEAPVWDSVLLVDDVYTTGSTVDAAAKALREHGVPEIYFVTIAIGEGAQ